MARNNVDFEPPKFNSSNMNTIKPDEFLALSTLIREKSGIIISEGKTVMLESRLSKRLRHHRLTGFSDYIDMLKKDIKELEEFINALTTNKTDFFREPDHFDLLTQVCLPNLSKKKDDKSLKLWSAASSTGEEAYTIAIVVSEYFKHDSNFKILASDIDTKVLEVANLGIYRKDALINVRSDLLNKYFMRGINKNSGFFKIVSELKENIKFKRFNLLYDEFNLEISFDVIFLRNVLIYFDTDTIQKVVNKMYKYLKPGGYFFIGHSETLNGIKHKFKNCNSSVYMKE